MLAVTVENGLNELLLEAQKGSSNSFSLAVKNMTPAIRSFLRKRGVTIEDIDDVLQETFINIHKNLSYFNPEKGKAITWCRSIANKKAIDRFRHNKRRKEIFVNTDIVESRKFNFRKKDDRLEEVVRYIEYLPQDHRNVIDLYFFRGLSVKSIATLLEIPEGTVKSKTHRAVKLFKQHFSLVS